MLFEYFIANFANFVKFFDNFWLFLKT